MTSSFDIFFVGTRSTFPNNKCFFCFKDNFDIRNEKISFIAKERHEECNKNSIKNVIFSRKKGEDECEI